MGHRDGLGITRRLICGTTVAVIVVGSSAALAQDYGVRDGVTILQDFAQCVVHGDRGSASALLASMPGSPTERMIEKRIRKRFDHCLVLPDSVKLTGMPMRGAVAGVLYQQAHGSRPLSITPQGHRAAWLTGEASSAPAIAAPYAFAACVASADPVVAHALALSTSRSADEMAALKKLSTQYSACYPRGGTLRLTRITVRALVAEALYHLSPYEVVR